MKTTLTLCLLTFLFSIICNTHQTFGQSIFNVPLLSEKGTPSATVSIILNPSNDKLNFSGVPLELNYYRVQEICFNRSQKEYEDYLERKLKDEQASPPKFSDRDTLITSNEKYKHTVHILVGLDVFGQKVVIFDKNQNLDFSDEHIFRFDTAYYSLKPEEREKKSNNLPEVEISYEHFDGKKIQLRTAFFQMDPYRMIQIRKEKNTIDRLLEVRLIQNEYLTGKFTLDKEQYKIQILNKPPASATYLNKYIKIRIAAQNSSFTAQNMYNRGDTIVLNGHTLILSRLSMYGDSINIVDFGKNGSFFGTKEGLYAKDMSLNFIDEQPYQLYDLLEDSSYVILDFWGTWCQPCIKKIPELIDMHNKLQKMKNVKLISIAYDSDKNKVKQLITQQNMQWAHVFEDSKEGDNVYAPTKILKIQTFPAIFLIQPDRKIVSTSFASIQKWIDEKVNY